MDLRILFLMVARGGSKGIPKKNLSEVGGISLIGIRALSASHKHYFSRLIMSTDNIEIADEARKYSIDVPFMRPEHLAGDDSSSVDVVKHAVKWIEDNDDEKYDAIFLAEPSSPFCRPIDIERAIKMYKTSHPDLVVSVVQNKVHPIHMGTLDQNGDFSEVSSRIAKLPTGNRQQHKPQYIMNGCVYLFGWDYFKRENGIFPSNGRTIAFEMPELNSIEIDEMNELDLARYFVDQGKIDFNDIIGKGN
jgi:CMP-N,N'-diacetyllegionaminic acid synthase